MNETGQDSSDGKKPLESWKTAGIIVATATLMIGVATMGTFLNLKEQNRLMTEESATFSPCKIEEKTTSPMGRAGSSYWLHTSCGVFQTGGELHRGVEVGKTYSMEAYNAALGEGVSPVAFEVTPVE